MERGQQSEGTTRNQGKVEETNTERQFRVVVTNMGLGHRQAGVQILALTLEPGGFG